MSSGALPVTTRGLVFLALTALAAIWTISPQGVPLYDGVAFPDEPYRYVVAPADQWATTPPPTAASTTFKLTGLDADVAAAAVTEEKTAQFQLNVTPESVKAGKGVKSVTVTGTPLEPQGLAGIPEELVIIGNVYRVEARADADKAPSPSIDLGEGAIALRSTFDLPRDTGFIIYRPKPDTEWKPMDTQGLSPHQLLADLQGQGDYAMAVPKAAIPTGTPTEGTLGAGNSAGSPLVPFTLGVLTAGLFATVALLVVSRRRAASS